MWTVSGLDKLNGGKPIPREIIPKDPQRSFRCLIHDFPAEICGWGAHPEYEIHHIQHSSGTFIAGDYVGSFVPGHISIMGPRLPHDWVSDLAPGEVVVDRDVLVQFTDEWIRECMRLMPELRRIDGMLTRSSRGVLFTGDTATRAVYELIAVNATSGPQQLAHLFALLGILGDAPQHEYQVLASEWIGKHEDETANAAVEAGLNYIFDNLTGDIRLSTAAQLAYMSEPTFSKYFKKASGMTFSNMVKKLRIANARQLLDTSDLSVAQVASASGYRNMANFNRQFQEELGMTPSAYRKLDASLKPPSEALSLGIKAGMDRAESESPGLKLKAEVAEPVN